MLTLKNWHYLSYKGHCYLCVQRKTNAFLDVNGRIWKFQEVSHELQLGVERCVRSVSPVCRCVLTIISVKILRKCDDTSLTVIRITISLVLK